MLGPLAGLGVSKAFRRLSREVDAVQGGMKKRQRSGPVKLSKPKSFISYEDPGKRFELHYPSTWTLKKQNGIHISSSEIFSFARVDTGANAKQVWRDIRQHIEQMGGSMKIAKHTPGKPESVRGEVVLGNIRFRYDGYAWNLGKEVVVLSLGNVIDPKRSRGIEKMEDTILSGIRRHFCVNPEETS